MSTNYKIGQEYIKGFENKFLHIDGPLKKEYDNFIVNKKGISDEELNDLLREFPDIPDSLIELLKYSNGTDIYFFQSENNFGIDSFLLCESSGMIDSKNYAKDILDRCLDIRFKKNRLQTTEYDDTDIIIDSKITDDSDNVNWLSLAMHLYDDIELFIDFTPSKEGKVGQIIKYSFEDESENLIVIADSFDEFLQQIIDNNYRFIDEENKSEIEFNKKLKREKITSIIDTIFIISVLVLIVLVVILGIGIINIPHLSGGTVLITLFILIIFYSIYELCTKNKRK